MEDAGEEGNCRKSRVRVNGNLKKISKELNFPLALAGGTCSIHASKSEKKSMLTSSKTPIIEEYRLNPKDTGSTDVQVAVLTNRINQITEHLQTNRKDHSSRRGLLQMVSRRRKLLSYLQRTNHARYQGLVERLKLRK
jgi:small subunit ribosomal protein S15